MLFQPKIGGVDQSGLTEVIIHVLNKYNENIQKNLLQNIFLTVNNLIKTNFKIKIKIIPNFREEHH